MIRVTIGVMCAVASALLPAVTWAQERSWGPGWGPHPMGWMWGAWGIGMMLMMVAFWVLVIAGIVVAVRWLTGSARGPGRDRALEILRERYARGEINKEEFDSRRRDLS